MFYNAPLMPATFESRLNRFLGRVVIDGTTSLVFIPDPGRLEILKPGSRVYMLKRERLRRKTGFDLVQVDLGHLRVSTDSRIPNKVFEEALALNLLPEFKGFRIVKKEPFFKGSRLDFKLGNHGIIHVEVKSCTLVKDGVGLFPDAPTLRGNRQLESLVKALELGRSAIFFLVQREDAGSLKPYTDIDPNFSRALRDASRKGVEAYAYNAKVTSEGVFINRRIPVSL
ncbi:DNA/RNA nuclease SfsA [Candidatus Bathyarchaeota archaeon]|nr:DNA/RNA nuclease SfsA [Candidatus Bathyarchaeota archaeon]MBS7630984.1 DNA/RNA nuclease SfsA [Candidatus Bathyarchaeota archaeon]